MTKNALAQMASLGRLRIHVVKMLEILRVFRSTIQTDGMSQLLPDSQQRLAEQQGENQRGSQPCQVHTPPQLLLLGLCQ